MDFLLLFYYVKEIVLCRSKKSGLSQRCLAFVVREHKKGRVLLGRRSFFFLFPQLHESMSQGKPEDGFDCYPIHVV